MAEVCLPPRHVLSDPRSLSADIAGDAASEFLRIKRETRRAPCAPRQICRSAEVVQVIAWTKTPSAQEQCGWREAVLYEATVTDKCQWRGSWMSSTAYLQCPDFSLSAIDIDGDRKFELLVHARWNGRLMSGYPLVIFRNQVEERMRK